MILCKLAIEEIDKDSNLLPRIEEIIKSNRLILSVLMNKGELSQIGDNEIREGYFTLLLMKINP